MKTLDSDRLPPDLEDVARLLRDERTEASAVELDQIKLRARALADARRRSTLLSLEKGTLVTSRLLITLLLAFGIIASGTGATLAIGPNLVGEQSASKAVYEEGTPPPESEVKRAEESGGDPREARPDRIGVAPATESGTDGTDPSDPTSGEPTRASGTEPAVGDGNGPRTVQAARQEASSGEDTLPFTGFAAMPILLIGVAMLGSGLFLRRRAAGA
jgi:hypothetical protein